MSQKIKKLDLREIDNSKCRLGCNTENRKYITEEGICKITPSGLDNLPVRCVGSWAFEKILYLSKYFSIFAQGMKNKWQGLNYVEICSGPGRCITREDGREFDGTALSVVNHDEISFIKKAIFIDKNDRVINALNKRIESIGKNTIAKAYKGDYNKLGEVNAILDNLAPRCLNLVFVDPTDCSVPYVVIESIVNKLKKVDLVMTVAMGTDVKRNIIDAIMAPLGERHKARNKYSRFLGGTQFFQQGKVQKLAAKNNVREIAKLFLEDFKRKLQTLGFKYFDYIPVRHFYCLLFATGDKMGLNFWKNAKKISPSGQRTFGF